MNEDSAPKIPASPYGPAPGAVGGGGAITIAPDSDPKWVERGRRGLRTAALVAGILAVVGLIATIVSGLLVESVSGDQFAVYESFTWTLVFASPALLTIAINVLIWRALLRPLARMGTGGRIALVVGALLALAIVSVTLVAVMLFAGFMVGALIGAGSGFGF